MLNLYLQRAGASGDIGLTLALQADHLLDSPVYEGEFALASFNPRALMALLDLPELDMASPQALTHVALSTRFAGDTEQVALNPLNIELDETDRKSTRLNSSHVAMSYAVFCLKKK